MKKLITLVLTFIFALCAVPVEAAKTPSLDFLKASYKDSKYTNVSQNGNISFELNKPIEGIDYITSMMPLSNSPIDLKTLINGLFDSTITYSSKQKTVNAGEKTTAEVNIKSNAPIKINNNLELSVNTNYSIWTQLDLTDKENVAINYVMSTPINTKYITMDIDDIGYADEQNAVREMISGIYISDEKLAELQNNIVDSIYKNAKVTGNAKNIKITFSDLGLKKTIADIIDTAIGLYDEETQKKLLADSEESFENLKNAAIKVPFFADDALVIEYKLDSKNRIINEKFDINVDLDLFKFSTFLTGDTEGLIEGKSNLSFSVSGETALKYNTVSIKQPEVTAENSISITELMPTYGMYEEYEEESYYSKYLAVDSDENFYGANGEKYIPLRDLLENFDYEVSYDNGIITATSDSEFAEYNLIVFDIKSNVVKTDTAEFLMSAAPVIKNGTSYITIPDGEALLNFNVWTYNYYPHEKDGYISIERNADEEDF